LEEKVRISPFELFILTIFFTTGTTILVIPAGMTAKTNQDAWLSAIIGIVLCAVVAYFFVVCGKAMGRDTFIQYLQRVYGKILGKLLGLFYIYFAFIGATTLLFYFGNFTTTQILTETPIEILNLMLAVLVMVVVRAGLEVLARTGELLFPWFIFLLFALVIFLLPELQLDRVSPLYEASIMEHLSASYDFVGTGGLPMVVILMFYPRNINRPDKTKWSFVSGSIIGTSVVGVIVILCILVLGASATARQMFPSYVLAKTVSIFDIIERIEAVMASVWILSIFFKTAIYFYACVIGLAQLLEVRNYRFLVVPVGILTVIFSNVVYPNVEFMSHWDSTYWNPYAMIMGFFIPALTLIIDKVKGRLKQNKLNKSVEQAQ
jgi:spore germination protein KB